MADVPFQVSALVISGTKRVCTQLNIADAARAHMDPDVAAMWDRPGSSSWHPGELFQRLIQALVKVSNKEQMMEINYRMGRDQFGPIVNGMIRIAIALSSPSPHTVFSNLKSMVAVALKGATVEYQRSGPQSGKVAITYPLPFPVETAHAWAGLLKYGCEIVGHSAVFDRVETVQNGQRYEVDLHW